MVKRRWQRRKSQPVDRTKLKLNTAKVWSQKGGILRFTLSYDLVEKLIYLRDGKHGKLNAYTWKDLHIEFQGLTDRSMPAIFVRLDKWRLLGDKSPWPKLSKRNDDHRFHTSINSKRIGIKPDIEATRLKLMWMKKLKGLLLIFPDDALLPKQEPPTS